MKPKRAREFVLGFTGETITIQSANYIEGDQYWESSRTSGLEFDFMIESPEREDDVTARTNENAAVYKRPGDDQRDDRRTDYSSTGGSFMKDLQLIAPKQC
jgi:hypothetical protein